MTPDMNNLKLTSSDQHDISVYHWPCSGAPKGVIQLAHGMGEHALRYQTLAQYLQQAGYSVFANDHRGHGQGALATDTLGNFGAGGFNSVVQDMALLSQHIKSQHPTTPLVLFGHSMGSFALQRYLIDHSDFLAGAALSGTTAMDLLAQAAMAGFKLENLSHTLGKKRTDFDWLSRDEEQVDLYINDPLCGFTLSLESLQSMFIDCASLNQTDTLKRIPSQLPLYLFTGDHDPVNHHLEWFFPLIERYRTAGLTDMSYHIFAGGRHETLNETNRQEVMRVLLAWLDRVTDNS